VGIRSLLSRVLGRRQPGGGDRRPQAGGPRRDAANRRDLDPAPGRGDGAAPDREAPDREAPGKKALDVDLSDYEGFLRTFRRGVGKSDDIVVHEMRLGIDRRRRAALVFVDGMVDRRVVGDDIARPLLTPAKRLGLAPGRSLLQVISEQVLSATQVHSTGDYDWVVDRILGGDTAVIIEGQKRALVIDTKRFLHRGPERPLSELNVKGSFEGFTEVLKVNITQVRRRVRSASLRVKMITLGRKSHNQVALLYIEEIANPALVREVERRVGSIQHEAVTLQAVVQCLIADSPLTPFPLFRDTERPDFTASELLDGKVAVMVDNTAFAAILPSTLFDFVRSSEDYSALFWGGTLLRPVRYIALLLAVLLPGLYVAVLSVHPTFIPHNLALSIIVSRAGTPFPPVIEAAILLLAVEILREAAVRLPSAMGPTLATVGGIVLGQAAVNARVVSDLSLIIIALTGIAQLIAPGFELGFTVRLLVWPFLIAASIFGLLGLVAVGLVVVGHLAGLESVGVPYLGPLITGEWMLLRDVFIRAPFQSLRFRPAYLWPLDVRKQGRVAARRAEGRRAAREPFPVGIEPMEELLQEESPSGAAAAWRGHDGNGEPGGTRPTGEDGS
jgi:spore germination protein